MTEAGKMVEELIARWKHALPAIVGGQRAIVQETIAALESLVSLEKRAETAERERDAYRRRGDNHAETLRSIARMDPLTEGDRMVLWARDGLSGYTEAVEVTLAQALDRATTTEQELARERERRQEMTGALYQASFCLRMLLPNNADAQLTVRMIDAALQVKPHDQQEGR